MYFSPDNLNRIACHDIRIENRVKCSYRRTVCLYINRCAFERNYKQKVGYRNDLFIHKVRYIRHWAHVKTRKLDLSNSQ